MRFPPAVIEMALTLCGRCCCICHKFCGTKMELHHIKQKAKGGLDTFENCIPLCFECHSEVTQYNPDHPKGTRFTPSELKRHRDSWYSHVKTLDDKSAPVSHTHIQNVTGAKNIVAGGDVTIATKIMKRNQVIPDPGGRHITEAEAFKIKNAVTHFSDLMKEAGLNPSPAALWTKLYRHFQVSSYREIPFGFADEAIKIIQMETAKARPRIRKRNPEAWRNQFYKAIWACSGAMRMEKQDVYDYAYYQLGLKRPIASLKDLTQKQLQDLDRKLKAEQRQ